jgi:hypothetical protein
LYSLLEGDCLNQGSDRIDECVDFGVKEVELSELGSVKIRLLAVSSFSGGH